MKKVLSITKNEENIAFKTKENQSAQNVQLVKDIASKTAEMATATAKKVNEKLKKATKSVDITELEIICKKSDNKMQVLLQEKVEEYSLKKLNKTLFNEIKKSTNSKNTKNFSKAIIMLNKNTGFLQILKLFINSTQKSLDGLDKQSIKLIKANKNALKSALLSSVSKNALNLKGKDICALNKVLKAIDKADKESFEKSIIKLENPEVKELVLKETTNLIFKDSVKK